MNAPVKESFVVYGSSREEVFAALLDVERFPEWAFGLTEARTLGALADSIAPGTTIEFALSAAGITHRVTSAITIVDPPRLLFWRYTKGATGMGGWTLEDLGDYAVKMTFQTSYEVRPPWLNRLANRPFFRGITENLLHRSMRRFADRLRKD